MKHVHRGARVGTWINGRKSGADAMRERAAQGFMQKAHSTFADWE